MDEIKGTHDFLMHVENELTTYINTIDMGQLVKACQYIQQAERDNNRVHVTGIGKPGHVAGYIASLLSSTGTPAYYLDASEAIHGSSGQVREHDVVIAISNSGNTEELKKTITTLKHNHVTIIAVTGNVSSWLYKQGDVMLFAGVQQEGDTLNKPPRASILAEIIVLQSLSVMLQYIKCIDKQDYVKWHPGGSLGASILQEEKG